jgi:hypothetical protein
VSTGGQRRRGGLFGGRPTLQVDEYVPGIVLPDLLANAAPVEDDVLDQDYSDEPEVRHLDEQQRRYEEYVSGGGGLRVFLGNPLERDRDARLSLPSNVEGLIWDASGLALEDEDEDEGEGDRYQDKDDDDEFPALDSAVDAIPMLQMPVLRQVGVTLGVASDEDTASPTAPPSVAPLVPSAAPQPVVLGTSGDAESGPLDEEDELLPAEEAPETAHEGGLDTPFERMAFSSLDDQRRPAVHSLNTRGAPALDSGTFDDPGMSGVDAVRRAFPDTLAATPPPTAAGSGFDEQETFVGHSALASGEDTADSRDDDAPATDWRSLAAMARSQAVPDDSGWGPTQAGPAAPVPSAPNFDTADGWFTKPPVSALPPSTEDTGEVDTGPSADRLDEEAELQSRTPAPLTTTNGSRIQWQRLNKSSGAATTDASKAALSNKVALATEDRTLPSFRTYEPTAEPDVVKGSAGRGLGTWALAFGLLLFVLAGAAALIIGLGLGKGEPAAKVPVAVATPAPRAVAPAVAPAIPADATGGNVVDAAAPPEGVEPAPTALGGAPAETALEPADQLATGADLASAAQAEAAKAQARLRASGVEVGMVTVTSNVPALVTIQGKVIGTTPIRMYTLAPGTYDVSAVARGQTRVITSRVDAGRVMGLRFDF